MCGICGIFRHDGVSCASDIEKVLSRLQHRGQESAGIAIASEYGVTTRKGLGLASHVSNVGNWDELVGRLAIGHIRYSTKGTTTVKNACPMEEPTRIGKIAITYNGNLINANYLRKELAQKGQSFETTTDTEVIIKCLAFHLVEHDMVEAIKFCMKELKGAYSIVVLSTEGIYGFCDPNGIRPMCLGEFPGGYMLASETCALNVVGATLIKEIENGQIVSITDDSVAYDQGPRDRRAMCIFEFIYMARPDSVVFGRNVSSFRLACGRRLAIESRQFNPGGLVGVIPMPNTGIPAGDGFAWESRYPVNPAVIKDRYHPERTFIRPDQHDRQNGINEFTVIESLIREYPIVIPVDDSVVRGTTKKRMVRWFREAGAQEVHLRIASPPYRYPCYFGVDTASKEELIASGRTIPEICQVLGADSLEYLSLEGLYQVLKLSPDNICDGCLTGNYPMEIPDELVLAKNSLE